MASTATTRRRLGQTATRPVAPGSSATAATNTRRRYAAAVLVVPGVRARPQRSSDRKGVHAEPVPHRAVRALHGTRCLRERHSGATFVGLRRAVDLTCS